MDKGHSESYDLLFLLIVGSVSWIVTLVFRSFVRTFVSSLVFSCVSIFIRSYVRTFVRSCVRAFIRWCVHAFHPLASAFVCSFVRLSVPLLFCVRVGLFISEVLYSSAELLVCVKVHFISYQ